MKRKRSTGRRKNIDYEIKEEGNKINILNDSRTKYKGYNIWMDGLFAVQSLLSVEESGH
jgi:molybdate-binding protein